jgi:hypothetical protein
MRRRDILLFGALVPWSLKARAQVRVHRIGVLVLGNNDPDAFVRELRKGLGSVGLIEGRNIILELRSADGKESLLAIGDRLCPKQNRPHCGLADAGRAGSEIGDRTNTDRYVGWRSCRHRAHREHRAARR